MFTTPNRDALISIVYPIGNYAGTDKLVAAKRKRVRGRYVTTPEHWETVKYGFFEGRLKALDEVINDTFDGAFQASLFGTAFYIAVRCLDWVKF